jgi:hypothetical protein
LERLNGRGGTVQVLDISSDAPSVEIGFKNFRPKNVVCSRDVEAVQFIESILFCAWRGTGTSIIPIFGNERKDFWANLGSARYLLSAYKNCIEAQKLTLYGRTYSSRRL